MSYNRVEDPTGGPIWLAAEGGDGIGERLKRELGLSPLLARILASRGFEEPEDAREFLEPSLSGIEDPFAMRDMDRAVERVERAIRGDEKIVVFGDFDVDGLTSTALVLRLLKRLGAESESYIPHRMNEGYGLNKSAIKQLADGGAKLLLTVDNGITSVEEIEYATTLGLDVVVTDHHLPGPELPGAVAVVDPNRADCDYPFTGLAGVGVAFKFAHALMKHMGCDADESIAFLKDNLDLVAIGSISDIVPLLAENRILAKHGLRVAATTSKTGLRVMLDMLGIQGPTLSPRSVGFMIGPRLNAAGRTEHADVALELLLTDDADRAREIVQHLGRLNDQRRKIESAIVDEAVEQVEADPKSKDRLVIVVAREGWHLGVAGIVASRLLNRYSRPTLVLCIDGERAKGSGRSLAGFDLVAALEACSARLLTFGGHSMAAGLQLKAEQIGPLRDEINQHARAVLGEVPPRSELKIEAEVGIGDLDLATVESLSAMEPFGPENPEPVVALRGVRLAGRARIVGTGHLKLTLGDGGLRLGAIGFGLGDHISWLRSHKGPVDVAGAPSVNDYNSRRSPQLEIRDIRPAE